MQITQQHSLWQRSVVCHECWRYNLPWVVMTGHMPCLCHVYVCIYCGSCHVKWWQVKQHTLLLCSINQMLVAKATAVDVKVNTGGLSTPNLSSFLDGYLWSDTSMVCSDHHIPVCSISSRWNSVYSPFYFPNVTFLSKTGYSVI